MKKNIKKKIYIYYPSRITGGAEFLLKTVADLLKADFQVFIVDIEGGWLSLNVKDVGVITVENGKAINLDENSILITTANLIRNLDAYFLGNFKIVAWIVQVNNIIPVFPKIGSFQFKVFFKYILKYTLLKSEYEKINKLALYLEQRNSLYTMDDACNDVFYKYFNWKIINYLPVIIPDEKILPLSFFKNSSSEFLRCVWVGRLDNGFKNPILEHVILDVEKYATENKLNIVFDIIGNGPGLLNAQKTASKTRKIKVSFLGELRGRDLIDNLITYDIGFAMGTSALEISACGVPVVLLDASYGKVPAAYKYQWLYESTGYCIGRSIDSSIDKTLGNKKNITGIFDDFLSCGSSIRARCYEHVKNYHSKKVLEEKLFLALQETKSNFQEMVNLDLINKPYWSCLKRFLK